jgi:hypothetical protein
VWVEWVGKVYSQQPLPDLAVCAAQFVGTHHEFVLVQMLVTKISGNNEKMQHHVWYMSDQTVLC